MKVAIIGGAGKMGKWLARFLQKEGHEIIVCDKDKAGLTAVHESLGVTVFSSAKAIAESDLVLLAVNIDSFEEAVKEIGPFVRPGQIILDITSIKEQPVELMHKYLGKATILGTHPLFGPGAKDIASQNFVLTPTNEMETVLAQKVMSYLQKHNARVTLMTPRKHDEMMAVVLGLAHFISIVAADTLAEIGNQSQLKAIGGSTFRVLTTLVESVVSEDPELYASLQMKLPYVTEVEELFQIQAAKWAEIVKNKDRQTFVKQMTVLKYKFATDNTNFGQAYENMYKIIEWL
jgi:prephenate dehydrogenase